MKLNHNSLAVKTVCFLLLVILSALTAASALAACYLADQGAYTMSQEEMMSQGLQDRLQSLADDMANFYAQEQYGDAESWEYMLWNSSYSGMYDLSYYSEGGNYCYEIRDSAGVLLKSTYSGQAYLATRDATVCGAYYKVLSEGEVEVEELNEPYTVTGYVLEDMSREDTFSRYVRLVNTIYSYRITVILGALGGLVACICLLVYLLSAAGHRPGREEIVLNPLDRLPGDLYFGAVALAVAGMAAFLMDYWWGEDWIAVVAYAGSFVIAEVLVLGFLLTLATRLKYGRGYWWRQTLTGWCLRMLRRLFRWLVRGLCSMIGLLPLTWRWLAVGAALWLVSLFCLNPNTSTLGMLIPMVLWGLAIAYTGWSFGKVRKAAQDMARGELEKKLDASLLLGGFRQMGQDLNALGQGASLAVERQLKSERMKTELITNVSHDIKTPLTSIVNYVDLLQKPHTPAEGEQYLEVLARQSQKLKKLTEDLVEMSKASSGSIPVNLQPTNVVELVNQALAEYEAKLEKANLPVVLTAQQEEVLVCADGRLFWRVLDNLLGNCVKYAQSGTRIYVDVVKYEKKVMISIKNVSRDKLNLPAEELMERFVRGDRARNTEGSGLGLNIAKTLMELQQGRLNLVIDGDLFKAVLLFDTLKERPEP